MTEQEIKRLKEENKKAVDHLLNTLDAMPPINCQPCWLARIFDNEPTILLEDHRLGRTP